MGWLHVLLPIIAAWRFGLDRPILFAVSQVTAAVCLFTYWLMYTYARAAANRRRKAFLLYTEDSDRPHFASRINEFSTPELTVADTKAGPNWPVNVNMIGSLTGLVLLILSFVI